MEHLINKDALIVEIDKGINGRNDWHLDEYRKGYHDALTMLKKYLSTLEVKEVDLDKSARYYLLHEHISPLNEIMHQADLKAEMQYHKDIENAFKAGFELGLKAQKGE